MPEENPSENCWYPPTSHRWNGQNGYLLSPFFTCKDHKIANLVSLYQRI